MNSAEDVEVPQLHLLTEHQPEDCGTGEPSKPGVGAVARARRAGTLRGEAEGPKQAEGPKRGLGWSSCGA